MGLLCLQSHRKLQRGCWYLCQGDLLEQTLALQHFNLSLLQQMHGELIMLISALTLGVPLATEAAGSSLLVMSWLP